MSSIRHLAANGGWKNAWRGLPPTLWRDVPFSGVYWAGYEGIKRTLTGGKGMGEVREGTGVGGEFGVAFLSGAGSGMVSRVSHFTEFSGGGLMERVGRLRQL